MTTKNVNNIIRCAKETSRLLYFYQHQHFSHSHDQRGKEPLAHLEGFAFINNYRRKVVKMALTF